MRILIIEDDQKVAMVLRDALERIVLVGSGPEELNVALYAVLHRSFSTPCCRA
jgi:DNA-binding response OmpR family regulator